jgi:hypothetical protein
VIRAAKAKAESADMKKVESIITDVVNGPKTFTVDDIEKIWKAYNEKNVLRALKDGKWTTIANEVDRVDATSVKMEALPDVMEFPEYLRKEWTK